MGGGVAIGYPLSAQSVKRSKRKGWTNAAEAEGRRAGSRIRRDATKSAKRCTHDPPTSEYTAETATETTPT